MNRRRSARPLIAIGANLVLLFVYVRWIVGLITWNVPWDVTVYENWDGAFENPVKVRFGAGCLEVTILLLLLIVFIALQIAFYKKYSSSKALMIIGILAHVSMFVAGFLYVQQFGAGFDPIYMIEQLLNR